MQTEIAYYAVRDLVPGFLDVAGLGPEAEEMRGVDLSSSARAGEVVALLRRVKEEAAGRWAPVLQDVCFWAEAVVWTAWDPDAEPVALEECRSRLATAISDGYALMTLQ